MDERLSTLWVYLAASPLLHLTLTLCAYLLATRLHRRLGRPALLNPVLVAIVTLVALLKSTGTDYPTYFAGAQFVHFLLGPATVALAIPLNRQLAALKRNLPALLAGILCGSLTAALSAILLARLLGAGEASVISLAPKSVTTPIAMGISERLGGLPSLTAVLVILTGILGAILGPVLLRWFRIDDPQARGVAMGTAAHGLGTARAMELGEAEGAMSGLAMGINALATALLLPLLWLWLSG